MEIISVNITKGGCGKTTTAQMMAEILNKLHGKRVLCIDTDPQCNLSTVSGLNLFDYAEKQNLHLLLKGDSSIEDCIVSTPYYDLIPGSLNLASADMEFNGIDWEYLLKEKIENLDYDFIIIDTPPALGKLNLMSLTASTRVLIPAEASYLAMMGIDQLGSTINAIQRRKNSDLKISGILLVKYNNRAKINKAVSEGFESMASNLNTNLFKTQIRETVRIKEAQSQQAAIIDWDAKCSAVEDYIKFVEEFIKTL